MLRIKTMRKGSKTLEKIFVTILALGLVFLALIALVEVFSGGKQVQQAIEQETAASFIASAIDALSTVEEGTIYREFSAPFDIRIVKADGESNDLKGSIFSQPRFYVEVTGQAEGNQTRFPLISEVVEETGLSKKPRPVKRVPLITGAAEVSLRGTHSVCITKTVTTVEVTAQC